MSLTRADKERLKAALIIGTCLIGGSILIGMEFGWKIGLATGMLAYAIMPFGR